MAVYLSIGRISTISMLAFLGLVGAAGTAHLLSRSGPEAAPTPISQIAAAVPNLAALNPGAAVSLPGSPAEAPVQLAAVPPAALEPAAPEPLALEPATTEPQTLEPAARSNAVAAAPLPGVALPPAEVEARDEARPGTMAVPAVPTAPATASVATPEAVPVMAPLMAQSAVSETPPAAPRKRIAIARLVVEPEVLAEPRDLTDSVSRPTNMAPIPARAPRAAKAGSISASRVAALFQKGAAIRVTKDASVYITARNIPANDRLLEAYSADRPNGGRVQTRAGEATAVPGLLGIAKQAKRSQSDGQGDPAYSLADAMRDAIWRKETAARLKSLTTARNDCTANTDDTAKRAPSIGLAASC